MHVGASVDQYFEISELELRKPSDGKLREALFRRSI